MAVRRVVSIEVGLTKTKVCELDYGKKNPKVYKNFIFDTPENAIEDAIIRGKQAFGDVLVEQLTKAEIKCQNLLFTVTSSRILSREIIIPNIKADLIPGLIDTEKEEYFPMDISEHELAYSVLETIKDTNQLRLMVYAVPATIITNYFNLTEEIGYKLVGLDYSGNAVSQWLSKSSVKKETEVADLLLQVNEQNTLVTILKDNVLIMQRNIGFGTANLVDTVMEWKKDGWDNSEAIYKLLREEQMLFTRFQETESEQPEDMDDELWTKRQAEMEALTDCIRPLMTNINRAIEFVSTKYKSIRIEALGFIGLGTRIRGLGELLSNEIGLSMTPLEQLPGILYHKGQNANVEQTYDLITCLGAVLAPIRYLHVKFNVDKSKVNQLQMMLILLGLSVFASAFLVIMSAVGYFDALSRREALQKEITEKQWIIPVFNEYVRLQGDKVLYEEMDKGTYTNGEQLSAVIEELENKLPTVTRVQSLNVSDTSISMGLTVNTKEEAQKLLMQLKEIKNFSSVQISGITETKDEAGMTEVTFTVICTFSVQTEEVEAE